MKTRLISFGFAVIAAALVACGGGGGGVTPSTGGGGGGGGGGSTSTPAPTAPPSPFTGCVGEPFAVTRHAQSQGPRPIAAGDTFTYSGTMQETIVRSEPCPEPTYSVTAASVSVTVTDSAATPAPEVDSRSVETDTLPLQTVTTTTDAYLSESATQALLYSTSSADGNGNTITTTYTTPQVIDVLPEAAGSWGPNDPTATVTENLSEGVTITRNVVSDGSYQESFAGAGIPSGVALQIAGRSNGASLDGSGFYVFQGVRFTYAAPTGPPPGGTITLSIYDPSTGTTKSRTFPTWFTQGTSDVSDTFVDNGMQNFDPSCTVPAALGAQGDQIVETATTFDPILGYTEQRTTTSYDVNGFGPACVVISDTQKLYYDYSTDTPRIDWQTNNAQPLQTSTITQSLSMTSPTTPYAHGRRPQSEMARPVMPGLIVARESAIKHLRELERAAQERALQQLARRFHDDSEALR